MLGTILPWFVTEDVAYRVQDGGGILIVCPVDALIEGEEYDGVASASCLAWLGFGFFATVSNFRPV